MIGYNINAYSVFQAAIGGLDGGYCNVQTSLLCYIQYTHRNNWLNYKDVVFLELEELLKITILCSLVGADFDWNRCLSFVFANLFCCCYH